jgi:hypothetical protein
MLAIPLAIGAASAAASAGAIAGGVTIAGLALSSTALTAISVGLSIAGTLAQTLLQQTPAKPKMQDGDVSIKQAIPPRTRMYGRQRLGGVFLYYDSNPDGDLNTLVCHAAHECDDSTEGAPNPEEHWLNDERVQIDEHGNVTDDPWWQEGADFGGGEDFSVVVIVSYLGSPDQTIATLPNPPWTPAHRGRGLCATRVKYSDLKDEDQIKVFPSGPPPYRAVLRGAKLFDPRLAGTGPGQHNPANEATWAWSDNAALVLLDYMTRTEQGVPVGFGISLDRVDLATFAAAADVCDQEIPIKIEGEVAGTEKRWRAWGAYELTEDRKAVLQDLLDACGGRIIQGPDGKLGLTVGAGPYRAADEDAFTIPAGAPAATVTLTDEHIIEWDMNQGKAAIERINEVRATYVSQAWEWAETEAGIQLDQAAIDRNGVESSQIKLRFVPSESQAQRVAREVLRRGNPSHAGRIRATLAGLDAWGERWIHLVIAELDIDAVFEITSMSLNQADMTVSIEVASYDNWWTWTAETDEQAPAVPPPNNDDDAEVPVPDNVAVSIIHRLYNSQTPVAVGLITWDPPPRSVYVAKARYRPVLPADSPWQPLPVAQDNDQVETFPLTDGVAYEAQVRFIGPRGAGSDWSTPPALFTAVADPVAPAAPVLLSATPSGANVVLSATAANSSNQRYIRFWRDSDATFAGAVDISGAVWTAANGVAGYTDTPGPGAWRYWATAGNWSGIESAETGPQAVTFTPAAPVIVSPITPYLTGDNTPTFSGTAPNATTVHLLDGATDVGSVAVVAGAWAITASTLADGTRNVTAKAVAPGGATSVASNTVVTTIDTVVSPPVITASSPMNTTDTTPDVPGTSEPGASIAMFRGGSTPAGSATANGSGVWTSTLSPALAVGSYSITAKQTDLAGNVSGASVALTLNIIPPSIAIATPSGGTSTYDRRQVCTGTGAIAGATIKLYSGVTQYGTATADGSGNWSLTPSSDIPLGTANYFATQTANGQESVAGSNTSLTVVAIDADAWSVITAMTVRPPFARQTLINDLVVAGKAHGWWTKMRVFGLIGADAQASSLNWKAPSTFVAVPTAAPTFTADREWKGTGNGSTTGGYLVCSYNAVAQSVAQNDHGLSIWVRTAGTATSGVDIGNVNSRIRTCDTVPGTMSSRCNDATSTSIAAGTPNGVGFYSINRSASTGYDRRHETTDLADAAVASTGASNQNIDILRGSATTYSDSGLCAWAIHTALTGAEQADMRTDWHTYLSAIGAVA